MEASVSAVVTRMEEKRKAVLSKRPPGETLLARYFDRAPD
jgi:hypothetical protein